MKNPLLKSLFLPCACCCLSANSAATVDYTFRYGPFTEGDDSYVKLNFLPSRFPDATHFFVDVTDKTDPSWHYQITPTIASLPVDKKGYALGTATIPASNLKRNHSLSVVFGLSKGAYYTGMNFYNLFLRVEDAVKVTYESGLMLFVQNKAYECNRQTAVYDPRIDPVHTTYHKDGYFLEGMNLGVDHATRRLPLEELKLYYVNDVGSPMNGVTAEIRFSTHTKDFDQAGVNHGGYVSLPLSIRTTKVSPSMYRYDILGVKGTLYYSRVDYKMYAGIPGEPYFASQDLYLPLREGHDQDPYNYLIFFDNLGEYGDMAGISDRMVSSENLFGPCQTADYCVVIGG